MTGQQKQALPEANRRAGTSAAVIGLAISVSAHGLLFPRQNDRAMAAEPNANEPTTTAVNTSFDVAALSPDAGSNSTGLVPVPLADSVVAHTVQEGQTLWQIARFYRLDIAALAAYNKISKDAVLTVGQVLQVPTDARIASAVVDSDSPTSSLVGYYGPIPAPVVAEPPSVVATVPDANESALKGGQDEALARLKQTRDDLRLSLKRLNQEAVPAPAATQSAGATVEPSPSPSAPEPLPPVVQQAMVQPVDRDASPLIPASSAPTYRVVPGDTLAAIARTHGVSLADLARVNRISDPDVVFAGRVLSIPSRTESGFAADPALPNLVAANIRSNPAVVLVPEASGLPGRSNLAPSEKATVVSTPTVLPATQSDAKSLQVATAPFINSRPAGNVDSTEGLRYNYVENLRQEVVRLREKYRNASVPTTLPAAQGARVAAVSLPAPGMGGGSESAFRVNPEFNPNTEVVRSQIRRLQQRVPQPLSSPQIKPNQPQRMAVAPDSSQNYEALVRSPLGQEVSPELPPLGSTDQYLPRIPGQFNGFIWPAKGILTSGYGWRWGRMHKGIDIAAPVGTPIVAASSGVVIDSGWNSGGYGYLVEIQHADGSSTLYAHNSRLLVRVGQRVEQGEQIAEMGSTGYSTGPHLHFEVRLPGQGAVNPMAHLPRSGV